MKTSRAAVTKKCFLERMIHLAFCDESATRPDCQEPDRYVSIIIYIIYYICYFVNIMAVPFLVICYGYGLYI